MICKLCGTVNTDLCNECEDLLLKRIIIAMEINERKELAKKRTSVAWDNFIEKFNGFKERK